MAYETPLYLRTKTVSTMYHDMETKVTITHEPTLVNEISAAMMVRLHAGGLVECDEEGNIIHAKVRNARGKAEPLKPVVRELNPLQKQEQLDAQLAEQVGTSDGDEGPGLADLLDEAEDKAPDKGKTKRKGK